MSLLKKYRTLSLIRYCTIDYHSEPFHLSCSLWSYIMIYSIRPGPASNGHFTPYNNNNNTSVGRESGKYQNDATTIWDL